MSQPESNGQGMKWMMAAMVVCCAIPIALFLALGGGLGFWAGRSSQQSPEQPSTEQTKNPSNVQSVAAKGSVSLTPAGNWRTDNHVHGLGVNSANPQIIYVASHNGLLQRSEDGKWDWMGKQRADYMGFTADPTNSKRFYSSGHPSTGGNLGFQVSDSQGEDWKQISMPGVDFHALAIAPSNPAIFYGYPASGAEGLHVSTDGGKTWKRTRMEGLGNHPFNLVVDPQNADRVYAVTQSGLYESRDRGERWTLLPSTQDAPIVGLALQTEGDKTTMYGYRAAQSAAGIYRSLDEGKTWEKWGNGTDGLILYLAIAPRNSQVFYAINQDNTVFQSQDSGKTWKVLS
jgi:photosystem II stability/assembly factor-like uncharacterized protein